MNSSPPFFILVIDNLTYEGIVYVDSSLFTCGTQLCCYVEHVDVVSDVAAVVRAPVR